MNERVLAKNQTSATPSQAIQASSPPLHQSPSTSGLSESFGSNSNISKGLGGIQPKTIRRSLNWQNISVEAPSRSDGRSSPGGIQRQQEEPGAVMGDRLSGDSVQKSALESSNSTISTEKPAQKPLIARSPLNGRNIPIEAPPRSSASSTSSGGIQRLETSGVKEQQVSTESLQRQPEGAIQAKSGQRAPQEKEEQNKESVQTKLTVGAPGDKYEQEADSMAAKVMTMPDSAIQQPIQRQTGEGTKAVQMQPLVNSITPLVQRSSGKEEEVQRKSEVQRASDGSSVASGSVENRLAGSKGGGSALPKDVRSFMEPRFGADFSNIKVHTDSNAVQMNKELGAQAFAHGSDIYYGAGKSPGKNELTAHELTHTIQQGAAVRMNTEVQRKPNLQLEEKEQLQAQKLPDDRTLKVSLNKELCLQRMDKQEEGELLPTTMPQRATLKDPDAIAFFDQKFKAMVVDKKNPKKRDPNKIKNFEDKFLAGAAKRGGGDLEQGLLIDYQKANKPAEKVSPKGEGVSQLKGLRQEAEELREEITTWVKTNNIKGGERLTKTIDSELKGPMTNMETKGLEATKARIEGFKNNLKGVRSEYEQAKDAPEGTEIGAKIQFEGKKVEIDQIIPGDPPTWVNVKNYNLFGLESSKFQELKTQAEMNLKAAEANAVTGKKPATIVFDFTKEGVTPEVATALRALKWKGRQVQVKGTEKPAPVPGTEQPLPQSK
jgi:hypothetical protein